MKKTEKFYVVWYADADRREIIPRGDFLYRKNCGEFINVGTILECDSIEIADKMAGAKTWRIARDIKKKLHTQFLIQLIIYVI